MKSYVCGANHFLPSNLFPDVRLFSAATEKRRALPRAYREQRLNNCPAAPRREADAANLGPDQATTAGFANSGIIARSGPIILCRKTLGANFRLNRGQANRLHLVIDFGSAP
jgi:hypothetical protein